MTFDELSRESQRLAEAAHEALSRKASAEASDLFRRAAELEQNAIPLLDETRARTRGIVAVSAVALWLKGGDHTKAETLAYATLLDSSVSLGAKQDLRTLLQAVWTEGAKKSAGVQFMPGQVLVSVKGGEIVTGGAPLELILDKVQTIQSMFYRTIEFSNGSPLRKTGRPPKELQDACRPWLFQSPPGSYQFTVAVQRPKQPDFFREDIRPEEITQIFLRIVKTTVDGESESLKQLVPDDGYRKTFLRLTRNLAPVGNSFERIEMRATGDTTPVSVGGDTRATINRQFRDQTIQTLDDNATPVELRGVLRGVHLDKDWLEVSVDGIDQRVSGLKDTVDDVIGPMVNRMVRVQAIRTKRKTLQYLDIELAE